MIIFQCHEFLSAHIPTIALRNLSLSDSAAARAVKTEHRERNRAESESVIRIKTQAERSVNALGGDVKNVKHLLGQHTIQFGQFR